MSDQAMIPVKVYPSISETGPPCCNAVPVAMNRPVPSKMLCSLKHHSVLLDSWRKEVLKRITYRPSPADFGVSLGFEDFQGNSVSGNKRLEYSHGDHRNMSIFEQTVELARRGLVR